MRGVQDSSGSSGGSPVPLIPFLLGDSKEGEAANRTTLQADDAEIIQNPESRSVVQREA